MCTEEKKMVMGEMKKAEAGSQIMKGAEEVKAEVQNDTEKAPVMKPVSRGGETASDLRTPMEFLAQGSFEEEEEVSEAPADDQASTAEEKDPEEFPEDQMETDPLDDADAVVFEIPAINTVCPMITVMGARVAKSFDMEVEMGAFECDEDDIVIDLLKRLYRAKMYVEGMELLDMALSMIHCNEAIELADTAMQTLDDRCCKQFLESFICGSSRCDLEHLQKAIRKGR